jgi:hypothetical protein
MVPDYTRAMSRAEIFERIRREPLWAFLMTGALLFVIDRARAHEDPSHTIVIDAAFVDGLRADAERRTGHAPDDAQTSALIDAWVREETLYREARAIGLDEGDTIVRRRLVQKMELLLGAEITPIDPSDAELEAYLAAHQSAFARPTRSDVRVCFFAREQHDDAMATATAALAAGVGAPCDPHLSGDTFQARTDTQLRSLVGDALTDSIAHAPLGAWAGPFDTPRGVYLVRVDAREPGAAATLPDVREDVRDAWIEERRTEAVTQSEQAIARRYRIERP